MGLGLLPALKLLEIGCAGELSIDIYASISRSGPDLLPPISDRDLPSWRFRRSVRLVQGAGRVHRKATWVAFRSSDVLISEQFAVRRHGRSVLEYYASPAHTCRGWHAFCGTIHGFGCDEPLVRRWTAVKTLVMSLCGVDRVWLVPEAQWEAQGSEARSRIRNRRPHVPT